MTMPSINCRPVSELPLDGISTTVSDAAQTISRLARILESAKTAAQRGDVRAHAVIVVMNDSLYELLAELRLEHDVKEK